ncbi:MAG: GNAT family N-acetyltransferase [Thermonemataceae bacterium]
MDEMQVQLLQEKIILENDFVRLIPFESERNKELKEIAFDNTIWTYMGMYIKDQKHLDQYIKDTVAQKQQGSCYPFLIIDKQSNQVAGSTRYGYLNIASQKCEIGWTWLGKRFQGTGLNKACKFELLNFGFESVAFRRIQFSADKENLRSQKAIAKLGATKEGCFRNNYIDVAGNSRNDVYFSIIKEEWPLIRQQRFSDFST